MDSICTLIDSEGTNTKHTFDNLMFGLWTFIVVVKLHQRQFDWNVVLQRIVCFELQSKHTCVFILYGNRPEKPRYVISGWHRCWIIHANDDANNVFDCDLFRLTVLPHCAPWQLQPGYNLNNLDFTATVVFKLNCVLCILVFICFYRDMLTILFCSVSLVFLQRNNKRILKHFKSHINIIFVHKLHKVHTTYKLKGQNLLLIIYYVAYESIKLDKFCAGTFLSFVVLLCVICVGINLWALSHREREENTHQPIVRRWHSTKTNQ